MLVVTEVVVVVVSSLVGLSAVSVMVETSFELGTVPQRAVQCSWISVREIPDRIGSLRFFDTLNSRCLED
jgi:hypothetical protein